jgi:uncharacterized protein DUF2510
MDHADDKLSSDPQAAPPAGWYDNDSDGLRYWDGREWTSQRAPAVDLEPLAKTILWAMSLGFGIAGILAWDAPVLAYFWPLGFGGASVALAVAAHRLKGETPWFATIALIAGLVAIGLGIAGYSEVQDARSAFDELG